MVKFDVSFKVNSVAHSAHVEYDDLSSFDRISQIKVSEMTPPYPNIPNQLALYENFNRTAYDWEAYPDAQSYMSALWQSIVKYCKDNDIPLLDR